MILDLILWFMCELIEIFATVKIYKKITNKVKSKFYFICLCFFTVILFPLTSLISVFVHYTILLSC